jgi:hypothetical protein
MLKQEATSKMLKKWKHIHEEYKEQLLPNRKNAMEVIAYLKSKYPVIEIEDDKWKQVVIANVINNICFAEKLPIGKRPHALVFKIPNEKTAQVLYQKQEQIFKGQEIFIGIELETAFIHVEGNDFLYDELFVFRGLDEKDLDNFFLVAEYITNLKEFGILEKVLRN